MNDSHFGKCDIWVTISSISIETLAKLNSHFDWTIKKITFKISLRGIKLMEFLSKCNANYGTMRTNIIQNSLIANMTKPIKYI